MELMEALRGRRTIRDYTAEGVAPAVVGELIQAAILAPSSMNHQPWAFVVIEGAERLAGYSARAKDAMLAILPGGPALAKLREHLVDPSFDIFYHAPVLVAVYATLAEFQAKEDCCLAAQNLMLAAHARGLGTGWIGLARPWLDSAEVKAELGVPADWSAVAPLIVGHPKAAAAPTPRAAANVIWCR